MLVENIKIVKVGEVRSGTSTTTGKPWSNRNLLLGFEDETGESYINALVNTADWEQMGLHEGRQFPCTCASALRSSCPASLPTTSES